MSNHSTGQSSEPSPTQTPPFHIDPANEKLTDVEEAYCDCLHGKDAGIKLRIITKTRSSDILSQASGSHSSPEGQCTGPKGHLREDAERPPTRDVSPPPRSSSTPGTSLSTTRRHETDGGVRLAGGRPGSEDGVVDIEEPRSLSSASTLPPPYSDIQY